MKRPDYNERKWGDLDLKYLVVDTDDYIVFIDGDLDLDWITSDDYDKKGYSDSGAHGSILSRAALLECKPNSMLEQRIRLDFKRLLGEAIARSLAADYSIASSVLDEAAAFLKNRCEEQARKWRLSAAGEAALLVGIFALLAWCYRDAISFVLGSKIITLAMSAAAGAAGALLSVIMRLGKEHPDCHAGVDIHIMEGRYRIVAGAVSAVFVAFALWSKVALPGLTNIDHPEVVILFAGLVAGLSERWAPSISSSISRSGDS